MAKHWAAKRGLKVSYLCKVLARTGSSFTWATNGRSTFQNQPQSSKRESNTASIHFRNFNQPRTPQNKYALGCMLCFCVREGKPGKLPKIVQWKLREGTRGSRRAALVMVWFASSKKGEIGPCSFKNESITENCYKRCNAPSFSQPTRLLSRYTYFWKMVLCIIMPVNSAVILLKTWIFLDWQV